MNEHLAKFRNHLDTSVAQMTDGLTQTMETPSVPLVARSRQNDV